MNEIEQRAREALETIGVVKPRRSPILPVVLVGLATALVGAIAAYVLDPQLGRTRRAVTRDRMAGGARRVSRWSARQSRRVASTATALGQRVQHAATESEAPVDEVALANRVKSELFRSPDIDKGAISVNVERDVVFLRGTAPTREQIEDIAHRATLIDGVGRVVNLLHLPGEPVPVMDEAADEAAMNWAIPR